MSRKARPSATGSAKKRSPRKSDAARTTVLGKRKSPDGELSPDPRRDLVLTTGSLAADLATFDATASATVASWTPVGWAWALPFDVATGRWGSALAHLALAVALLAGLWLVWVRQLESSLTAPLTSSGGQRIGRGRFLPAVLGTSPTATVATRRVRAWYRDSRLVGIALRTGVLPVFFVVAKATQRDVPIEIAAVVVFLFWVYICAIILLYGVEMTAAYARLRSAAARHPELAGPSPAVAR